MLLEIIIITHQVSYTEVHAPVCTLLSIFSMAEYSCFMNMYVFPMLNHPTSNSRRYFTLSRAANVEKPTVISWGHMEHVGMKRLNNVKKHKDLHFSHCWVPGSWRDFH